MEINSKEYWEKRFSSSDWSKKKGNKQTRQFGAAISRELSQIIPRNFSGSILDFGCGEGDSILAFKRRFPDAKFFGTDFSEAAIREAKARYGNFGEFFVADAEGLTESFDVIFASNVMEHVQNHIEVVRKLLGQCRQLFIIVPYQEILGEEPEHINSFELDTYDELGPRQRIVFKTSAWRHSRKTQVKNVFKNLANFLRRRPLLGPKLQIIYYFENAV